MSGRFTAWPGLVFGICCTLPACDTSCDMGGSTPVLWADGVTTTTDRGLVYESTPEDGAWLHFPSGREFQLLHDLGTSNVTIEPYLSFRSRPRSSDEREQGSFVAASGNLVLISNVTAESITVKNGTCENDYYLFVRAVAEKPSEAP